MSNAQVERLHATHHALCPTLSLSRSPTTRGKLATSAPARTHLLSSAI
jgi:hypothetical protein